jgi:hypothetical protein
MDKLHTTFLPLTLFPPSCTAQALYDCYTKLGPGLSAENRQLLSWELIMVRGSGCIRAYVIREGGGCVYVRVGTRERVWGRADTCACWWAGSEVGVPSGAPAPLQRIDLFNRPSWVYVAMRRGSSCKVACTTTTTPHTHTHTHTHIHTHTHTAAVHVRARGQGGACAVPRHQVSMQRRALGIVGERLACNLPIGAHTYACPQPAGPGSAHAYCLPDQSWRMPAFAKRSQTLSACVPV